MFEGLRYNEYDLVANSSLVLDLHEVQLQMFWGIASCYRKKTQIQSWSIAIQIQIQKKIYFTLLLKIEVFAIPCLLSTSTISNKF